MHDISKRQIAAIQRALKILAEPGQVIEVRVLNIDGRRNRVDSGYFDDFAVLAQTIPTYTGRAEGIYMMLNPVNPALLARAANRIKVWSNLTTTDRDIVRRHWLPIDIDPVRPTGISSSTGEHEAAHARAQVIQTWLSGLGWPTPLYADSGNGAHLLYRIDLPNDTASATLIQRTLQAIAAKHNDDIVTIDVGNFNAARIWKLYYTLAAKGDSTDARPHRWARIITAEDAMTVVSVSQLEALAKSEPEQSVAEPAYSQSHHFDVDGWLRKHGIQAMRGRWNGGWRWKLADCPFSRAHSDGAYVVQLANGAISAGCHHNSCQGQGWRELRAMMENKDAPSPDSPPFPSLEQTIQTELRTAVKTLSQELRREIRAQLDATSI